MRVTGALTGGDPVHRFPTRGLDHGAFIPLMAMYPDADIPVVQVSMPGLDPQALLDLGRRLRPLRAEGTLIIGSGFMTHSFAVFRRPGLGAPLREFDHWAAEALARGDVDELADYRAAAPAANIAHPTDEHFVPLLATLGAAHDLSTVSTPMDRFVFGNSTRSIQVA